jgi:hypothetical protein
VIHHKNVKHVRDKFKILLPFLTAHLHLARAQGFNGLSDGNLRGFVHQGGAGTVRRTVAACSAQGGTLWSTTHTAGSWYSNETVFARVNFLSYY